MKKTGNPFDIFAEEYDRWFDSERGNAIFTKELDCLRQAVDAREGRWLEVGVGSGRFARALGVGTGVDISPSMLKTAAERGIETHKADSEKLPFADGSFDGMLMVCTICFLKNLPGTFRECGRVLKAGGRMVIGFIPADTPWGVYYAARKQAGDRFYASARFYTPAEVIAQAEQAGFAVQSRHDCTLPLREPSSGKESEQTGFTVLSFLKKRSIQSVTLT